MSSSGVQREQAQRLRSVLYVPGSNARALQRARELPADGLIFDLEDAVAPEAKARAREAACEAVRSGGYAPRVLAIRINGIGTPWHEQDVAAAVAAAPDAILVPKIGAPEDLERMVRQLERLDAPRHTRLWAMLETPAAVMRSGEIASACERLDVLVMGTNDLLAELHAQEAPDRRPLELSLMLCLLAARASGRMILDGVHNDVRDAAGFAAECSAGRQLGFDGKTLIHPSQVEPCNAAFSPSPQELDHARRVVAAFARAEQGQHGVVTLDGHLLERLHADAARRILAAADADGSSI